MVRCGTGGAFSASSNRAQGGTAGISTNNPVGAPGGDAEGGGIYAAGTSIEITNAQFSSNIAQGGAGGLAVPGQSNGGNGGAGHGGGLFAAGPAIITNTTFASNQALGGSPGMRLDVTGFSGGGAAGDGVGGGIHAVGQSLTISNSTFAGNHAQGGSNFVAVGYNGPGGYDVISFGGPGGAGRGGGLFTLNGLNTINCTTFSNNTVTGGDSSYGFRSPSPGPASGGGILNSATLTLIDTIVAGSSSGDVVNSGGTVNGSHNLIQDGSGGLPDTIVADPVLAPLANNGGATLTAALLPGSPAIGAGVAVTGITTDQRGLARTGPIDIGAFQSRAFTLAITGGDGQSAYLRTAFASPLTVQVTSPFGDPVVGGVVTFAGTPSAQVASTDFSSGTVTVAADGSAKLPTVLTANAVAGTFNTITAGASGSNTVHFTLTNLAVPNPLTATSLGDSLSPGSLRAAIIAFNADPGTATDTISLQAGTYSLTLTGVGEDLARKGDLDITSTAHQLIIQGQVDANGHPTTTIDASALQDRVFQIVNPGTNVQLKNLVIKGGTANQDPFSDRNTAGRGGAIFDNGGVLTIENVVFDSNTAQGAAGRIGFFLHSGGPGSDAYGGALYANPGSVLSITDTTFSLNQALGGAGGVVKLAEIPLQAGAGGAAYGGAIYADHASVTLNNCTFSSNTARGGDSLTGDRDSSLDDYEAVVHGNNGGLAEGGGVLVSNGTLTIANSTFSANAAQGGSGSSALVGLFSSLPANGGSGGNGLGGGASAQNASITVTNSTFVANTAQGGSAGSGAQGGTNGQAGVGRGGGLSIIGSATLTNSIVAGSTGGDVAVSGTLAGSHNLIQDGSGGLSDTIVANPLLGPLANNGGPTPTMALLAGSPAIAAGGAVTTLTQAAGATATTLFVQNAGAIASTPGTYYIRIGGEVLAVTNVNLSTNALTVTRGVNGTSAAIKANDPVYLFTDQRGYTVASNPVDIGAYQTRGVNPAPAFTSPTSAIFTATYASSFTVRAAGLPMPVLSLSPSDTLPSGLTYNPSTGVLSGTPAAGSAGVYTLHFTATNAAGSATQTFTLSVPTRAASAKFVQALYQYELGRTASATEVAAQVGTLDSTGGRPAVASGIASSTEARVRVVASWYRTYLGRTPSSSETSFWANLLSAQTEEKVLSQIVGSTEFYSRAQGMGFGGTPNENYVRALYQVLLGRAASSTEVTAQVNALAQLGQQGLALSILKSVEYRANVVRGYYTNLLGRTASQAEVASNVNSGLDLRAIRVSIESSVEFFSLNARKAPTITTFTVPSTGNEGSPVTLSTTAINAAGNFYPLTYTWTVTRPDNSTFTLTGASATFTPTVSGNYGVRLTVADEDGYSVSRTATLAVANVAPTVTVSAPGGTYNGSPFPATATAVGVDGKPVDGSFNFAYYAGGSASGTPSASAPTNPGTYTVVATFTSSDPTYGNTTAQATFTINPTTANPTAPTVSVSVADGTYNGDPFPASATAVGVDGKTPVAGTISIDYSAGSSATGTPSTTAPTDAGTYTVVATFTSSDASYSNGTAQATFTIDAATPTVSVSAAGGTYNGNPFPASATAVGLDGTPVAGAISIDYYAGASDTPLATPPSDAGTYTALALFTSSDPNYGNGVAQTTFTIDPITPTITWIDPADIVYGTPLSATQLDATADVPGTFAYTPAVGMMLDAGANQALTATFTPDDLVNYTTATQTVHIDVSQATPTITWADPAGITYGTPLDETQLNATADVPGTLAYTLPVGTMLNAGANQTLTVTFTPDDLVNYTTATQTMHIDVSQATPTVSVSAAGGTYNGDPFPASGTTVGVDGTTPVAGSFSFAYYAGSSASGTPSAAAPTDAGTYTVVATFTSGDPNYSNGTAQTTFTINASTISLTAPTVSVSAAGGTYNGNPFPASAMAVGLDGKPVAGSFSFDYYAGGSASGTPSATAPTDAGTYTVVATFTSSDPNYGDGTAQTTFTINQVTLTVTASNATRTYGVANPTFTDMISGFVNGDTAGVVSGSPTLITTATPSTAPGMYAITADVSALAATNYTFSPVSGTLTVNPAPLSATAVNVRVPVGVPFSGPVATFRNADPFGSPSSYSGTITWGDGTSSAGVISNAGGGTFTVSGSHTYAGAGTYAVSVRVEHRLGYTTGATVRGTATVSGNAVPSGTAGGPGGGPRRN